MDRLKPYINEIAQGKTLSREEAKEAFSIIMDGQATHAQIAAFLMGLRVRGEQLEEVVAAVEIMRERMARVAAPKNAFDIVGTGGDGIGTYNISTCSAFVIAAADIPVAKHGNKALSSQSGAADVLSELGLKLDLPVEKIGPCIAQAGIGFMFAPNHHSAMRHVGPARMEMGTRTIFNMLGPLSNPAGVEHMLVGVYAKELVRPVCDVLNALGAKRAIVVHGHDGLDEITTTDETSYALLIDGKVSEGILKPEDFGLKRVTIEALKGGKAAENAIALRDVLSGTPSAYADIVALNSGIALFVAGKAETMEAGVALAQKLIADGSAAQKLNDLVTVSGKLFNE